MIIVYNIKEYFTHQTYRTEKRVKSQKKKRTKQQPGVDPMHCACEIYSTTVE